MLQALRRRWVPAVCVGLVLGAIAALATRHFIAEGKHTARSQLYVSAIAPKVMFETKDGKSEFNNYIKAQLAMIRSRPILRAALARQEVADLPMIKRLDNSVEWLERNLQVDTAISPEIVRVYLSGDSPEELAAVVNAIADCYLNEVVNKERNDRLSRLDQLERSSKRFDDIIRENKTKRRTLSEKMGTGDLQALAFRERLLAERLATPQKELFQVQSDLRKLDIELAALKVQATQAEPVIPDADVEAELEKHPAVIQLHGRVAEAENTMERVRLVNERALDSPIFSRYRTELDSSKAALAERKASLRASIVRTLREKGKLDAKAQIEQNQSKLTQLRELEKTLGAEVTRASNELREFHLATTAMESFKEAITDAEDMSKQLTIEKERRMVEIQAPPRVTLWEEAVVTKADTERRRLLAAGLAAFGVMSFCLFAFAWWEFHARRIYAVQDVVQGLGMRVLGVLPGRPRSKGLFPPSTRAGTPGTMGPFVESVDSVRTMVAHAAQVASLRVILVTSAIQGEGKTMLSCHLAARLAASGRRTLLIDGDLRKPSVHKLFNIPAGPGLAELLRGEAVPEAVLHNIENGMLDVMPAGVFDSLASQALAQGRMHAVTEEFRDRYDYVVVDTSPVLPVPDAMLMAQHADGVIFAVLRDHSRIPKVNAAAQKLEALGVPVLGSVVNGGDSEGESSHYPA
jgi:capsular exopolysaccharide synthesis family protein